MNASNDNYSSLGPDCTEEEQRFYTEVSEKLVENYRRSHPDIPVEEVRDKIFYQLSGAVKYVMGDIMLSSLAKARSKAQDDLQEATDNLRGACVAAYEVGRTKSSIAKAAGITRATLDSWL